MAPKHTRLLPRLRWTSTRPASSSSETASNMSSSGKPVAVATSSTEDVGSAYMPDLLLHTRNSATSAAPLDHPESPAGIVFT